MQLCLIYAQNYQNAIGYKGNVKLPWSYKEDLTFFKDMTTGQGLLMGRHTFESMGKLPNRTHYVLTSDKKFSKKHPGVVSSGDFNELLLKAKLNNHKQLFIIGGSDLLNQNMSRADVIFRTLIPAHHLEGELAIVNEVPNGFNLEVLMDDGFGLVFQKFTKHT